MFSYIESQRNNLKAQTNKQQNSCFINYLELQPFIIQLKLQQMMTDIQIEPNPQNQLQIWNNFYLQQSQIEHKHILDQDFYLSQFICETKYSKQSSHQQAQNDAKFIGNLQKHQKQEEQFTISPKKSVFHNFQKHLLITLKQQITKKLLKNQSQLAKKMWNIFLDSNQFNKQILVVLFSKNYQKTLNLIEDKYGFAQIQRKNDPFDITEAQQSLKQLILNHFRTFPIEDMLQKRRLDPFQKTQLIQYIKQFLMELMNDNIQRRLPKKNKLDILNHK